MTRLFAMCGLSFSGKTTLASRAISEVVDAEYIGLDNINDERELRGGEGIPAEEWEKSSFIAVKRLETLLDAGRNVVLDDTLCFRWLRDRYAGVADRCGARFVLIYASRRCRRSTMPWHGTPRSSSAIQFVQRCSRRRQAASRVQHLTRDHWCTTAALPFKHG